MEKVKVTRYMPGKRPDYAIDSSSSDSDDDDDIIHDEEMGVVSDRVEVLKEQHREYNEHEITTDKRLARLRERSTHVERFI